MLKKRVKRILLKRKNIFVDSRSDINYGIVCDTHGKMNVIKNSCIVIQKMGYGCMIENVYGYGNIELGNYVSISGPGTILHSESGKISIGSFSSIAENVSIQEFNHCKDRPTTYAVQYNIFNKQIEKDVESKGDIVIEEDVWIGSNVVILSGVTIGHGSIIGAGSIVTKDIPPYAIAVGNPAHVMKYRFSEEKIEFLEQLKWWQWSEEKVKKNAAFFDSNLNEISCQEIDKILKN